MIDLILLHESAAEPWRRLIEASSRLQLVAEAPLGSDVLDELLERLPDAALALSARSALGEEVVARVARLGRRGVVEAPLSPEPMLRLPSHERLQIAHGWVSLPGRPWLERLVSAVRPPSRVRVDISGIPSGEACELDEVIENASALLVRLFPGHIAFQTEQSHEDAVYLQMKTAPGVEVSVSLSARGSHIEIQIESGNSRARYSAHGDIEHRSLTRSGQREERTRPIPSSAERALAQLVDPALGDSSASARRGWELAARILDQLPYRLGLPRRAFALSAARERASGLRMETLGLRGELHPKASDRLVVHPSDVITYQPLELLGVFADIKPVAFLTVAPPDLDRVVQAAAGLAIEQRERRVQIDTAQDVWTDERDRGLPFIELYISRDRAKAERAASLQAEGDPTMNMAELGALLGYPSCCVEAFAKQRDRSNNTANRYASFARTQSPSPWPFELSNFWNTLTPFFPCRYDCPPGLSYSRRTLQALEERHPGTLDRLEDALAHPMLYFTHGVSLSLRDGIWAREGEATKVRGYSSVGLREGGDSFERELASWLAAGDEIELTRDRLLLLRSGQVLSALERVEPRLGLIAPFGKGRAGST